jgi:hypothetical protein
MFRKITLALAAATVVATAAIPTAASAYWDGYRYHNRPGFSVYVGSPYASYGQGYGRGYGYGYGHRCYFTRRWVHTHWGWRPIRVRHCY